MDVDPDLATRIWNGEFEGGVVGDEPDYSPDKLTSPFPMEEEVTPVRFDQTPLDGQGLRMATAMPGRVCIGDRREGGVTNGHNHERKTWEDADEGPDPKGRAEGIFGTSTVRHIWP